MREIKNVLLEEIETERYTTDGVQRTADSAAELQRTLMKPGQVVKEIDFNELVAEIKRENGDRN